MKQVFLLLSVFAVLSACDKNDGIVKQPESVQTSLWRADNGKLAPRSDYFILWFGANGNVTLSEAKYSPDEKYHFEYVFRSPSLGAEAYYDEGKGSYSQEGKKITFNLTASGPKVPGVPSLGSHSITFTSGEIVGIANLVMDVKYTTTDDSGETSNGTLKFSRLYE